MMRYHHYGDYPDRPIDTYDDFIQLINDEHFGFYYTFFYRFINSNGIVPKLAGDSRFFHLIEVVPSDGSRRFRTFARTNNRWLSDFYQVTDLFAPGDVFSMETCADAFANAPLMNDGSSLDYEVRVDYYDPRAQEAIITVTKIR